jgi:hypothetical protein
MPVDFDAILDELLRLPAETEWVEFKHNENPQEIGEYLSAVSNAAALHRKRRGYLVWGRRRNARRSGQQVPAEAGEEGQRGSGMLAAPPLNPRINFAIHERAKRRARRPLRCSGNQLDPGSLQW